MFTHPRKHNDPKLGELTFANGYWQSASSPTPAGDLYVSVAGSDQMPDSIALTAAQRFLGEPAQIVATAKRFAMSDKATLEFTQDAGELHADGAFFQPRPGEFEIMLSLSGWADAAILVRFVDNIPTQVDLSD